MRSAMLVGGLACLWLLASGCSSSPAAGLDAASDVGGDAPSRDTGTRDQGLSESGGDLLPATDGRTDLVSDLSPADAALDVVPDAGPVSPYKVARGLIHMHSIYSHDGCDSQGFISGKPNTQCLKELRDAVCANGFDFMFLTDHPSNMKDYTLQQDMLHDAAAGDKLVLDTSGKAIANRVTCASGQQVLISVGFEATHMMPLGFHALPASASSSLYGGITDSTASSQVQAQVAGLKALGAVVAMVHSEETDISASTIDAGGFEAMEWYNIHASILMLLSKDLLSVDVKNIAALTDLVKKLVSLDPFVTGSASAPHPDLVYLLLLDKLPQGGFNKWRAVQKQRHITGVLGSDIHRNVTVDGSMCAGAMQLVCVGGLALVESAMGVKLPTAIKNVLLKGGTIDLTDGDRVDAYDRLMRWLENRVLVTSVDQLQLQDALRKGRAYGVFTVFGDPQGFSFTAAAGGGSAPALQLGDSAKGPLTLTVQVPAAPVQMRGAKFTGAEALKAEVNVKLLRTDSAGTAVVATSTKLGAKLTQQVTQPGAYHVEIWLKPKHLVTALGSSSSLANQAYLWVISNPIFLTK